MMRVYDVFSFFNEFDLLKIRMDELKGIVDEHILLEAPLTYTGKLKALAYQDGDYIAENITVLSPNVDVLRKLNRQNNNDIHYIERFQRNFVTPYLMEKCKKDDVIIFSDVDEIPNRKVLIDFIKSSGLKQIRYTTRLYRYFYNLYFQNWKVSHIFRWDGMWPWINDLYSIRKRCNSPIKFKEFGWHFSAVGTFDEVWNKLSSKSSANESRIKKALNEEGLKARIRQRMHPFKEGKSIGQVHPLKSMPKYIQDNYEEFKHLLLEK
jgi:beta-1,4-mannosyl-glycoprotein beta-1,4-N-acetylglucosaminyltransferase